MYTSLDYTGECTVGKQSVNNQFIRPKEYCSHQYNGRIVTSERLCLYSIMISLHYTKAGFTNWASRRPGGGNQIANPPLQLTPDFTFTIPPYISCWCRLRIVCFAPPPGTPLYIPWDRWSSIVCTGSLSGISLSFWYSLPDGGTLVLCGFHMVYNIYMGIGHPFAAVSWTKVFNIFIIENC